MKQTPVEIIEYQPQYQADFMRLNLAWIEKYFIVEDIDRQLLERPGEEIIAPGGTVLLAQLDGAVVGTAAMVKLDDGVFELSKMSVDETLQGRGIGRALLNAAVDWARAQDAREVVLETNTILGPAIHLYESVGFEAFEDDALSHYERVNLRMRKVL
ncbi:MAG: GNAT family N-acetyltransferase [Candidatus Hinthialibacter antarcticus]|nr:GNAT family N-acetyltransferase [Candidatus Hinthialibacter antarcticus]